jgi:diadenosine tetraphosphate (Ap4A) HIT family hydrolase
MHAPEHDMEDFSAIQQQMRQFQLDQFGKVAFFENGGINQEVPHAHLHAMPLNLTIPEEMIEQGIFKRLSGWEEVREECQNTGH